MNKSDETQERLWELERYLSMPEFDGIPMGSTLGDYYYLDFYLGKGDWSLPRRTRDLGSTLRSYWRGPVGCESSVGLSSGRVLIKWTGRRSRNADQLLPVIQAIGADQCAVIGSNSEMRAELPKDTAFLVSKDLPKVSRRMWTKKFVPWASEMRQRLSDGLRKGGFPARAQARLFRALLENSQSVLMLKRFLGEARPALVLTSYDRNSDAACLVLVARSMGIPTLTLVHGVMNHGSGYTPLLADKALCWGELQRQQFLRLGVAPERLIVAGCPWLTRTSSANTQTARRKAGLDPARPVALLATNPIRVDLKLKIAEIFCDAIRQVAGVQGVVRLHPSEKVQEYGQQSAKYPEVLFMENQGWSLDEAVSAANLVVGHDSGFCNDALLKGRPVVILHCSEDPLGNGQELIEEAGVPCARSALDLTGRFRELLRDSSTGGLIPEKTLHYLSRFLFAGGEEAATNVARMVWSHSRRAAPLPALDCCAAG